MLIGIMTYLLISSRGSFRSLSKTKKWILNTPKLFSTSMFESDDTSLSQNLPNLANLNKQIFCNVELNGQNLEAVGFDMDFTLAQYKEEFDLLAFEGAKNKLVRSFNYPKEVLNFEYCSDRFRRGLIIDQKAGNVLKCDRHKYVRKAFHGLKEMDTAEKKVAYTNIHGQAFSESNYVNLDTCFLIVDAALFMHLVDLKDTHPHLVPKSYEQIYSDIRDVVDQCHKDGTIKDVVMSNPEKYIVNDEATVPMLQKLRKAGKKVFLATNSLWEYTDTVMDYIVHANGQNPGLRWEELFDVVIVGACKPAFLTNDDLAIFRVDKEGRLYNVEDKRQLRSMLFGAVAAESDAASAFLDASHSAKIEIIRNPPHTLPRCKTFQGGSWSDLHKLLDITAGDRVLYVGDHMFSDILKARRTLGWRTCLVIPELQNELQVALRETALAQQLQVWRDAQLVLDDHIDRLEHSSDREALFDEIVAAKAQAIRAKEETRKCSEAYNQKFNKYWGQIFKAGHQDSRFGKQVIDYACLYTSRASNLLHVHPNRAFRTEEDLMPHDKLLSEKKHTVASDTAVHANYSAISHQSESQSLAE